MVKSFDELFVRNKQWVSGKLEQDARYFEKLSKGQTPPFLWIGCSDSRVPANEVTGTEPGEIFVHRNIANMVVHGDISILSTLDYALNVLGVEHIIVCGHYGCGGVLAAMGNSRVGLVDNWLRPIKETYGKYNLELDAITDQTQRANRFVELNVQEQVHSLCKMGAVQNIWAQGKTLHVHGIVYDLATGLLKDLNITHSDTRDLEKVFVYNVPELKPA